MTGIGAMLTAAREARGLTLEQAERDTRIVRRYLVALEEGDFTVFPAEVYARGFLRSYAGYLGLNPAEVLALFPPQAAPEPEAPPHRRPRRATAEPPRSRRGRRPALPRSPGARLMGVVVAVLLVAYAVGRLAAGGDGRQSLGTPAFGRTRTSAPAPTSAPPASTAVAGRMPDLRGVDEESALTRLTEMGVTPFVIEIPSREAPAGRIVRQSPGPNEEIGTAIVTIVVSRGG